MQTEQLLGITGQEIKQREEEGCDVAGIRNQYEEVQNLPADQQAERLAGQRYIEGLEQILTVLETERARRQAENELAIAQGRLWEARVDLLLALGGDWGLKEEHTTETKANSTGRQEERPAVQGAEDGRG